MPPFPQVLTDSASDMHSQETNGEMLVALLIHILNECFLGYLIGNITSLVSSNI